VSRILVADDNSNIQKMVALALKDEGIDVVAVGNGDAAIRKIPELRPDLVLADIFMPVRSGYEVCEFVKNDSRYMHTPVVLLVGAFDPLDEQETQRVRADGVLKKPFVPPDPLINMVKALLAKANAERPVPVAAAVPAQPAVQTQLVPSGAWQPGVAAGIGDPPTERLRDREKVTVTAAERPPSLDTPKNGSSSAPELASLDEDPDAVITAPRDPSLGDPVFSVPEDGSEEPEEGEEEAETKPRDMVDVHSWGQGGTGRSKTARFQAQVPAFEESNSAAPVVEKAPTEANVSLPLAATASDASAAIEDYSSEEHSSPASSSSPAASAEPTEMPPFEALKFDPVLTFPNSPPEESPVPEQSSATMNFDLPSAPSFEAPSEPVEQQATEPTAYMDLMPLESPVNEDHEVVSLSAAGDSELGAHGAAEAELPVHTPEQLEPVEANSVTLPAHDAMITAATEAARLALSQLNPLSVSGTPADGAKSPTSMWADLSQTAADAPSSSAGKQQHSPTVGVPPNGAPSPASPEMIEAVVNRLLERMQPQVMDVVNREVLRPAIEAMVREEMKKS
jgi:CheY-like chemotaxis protein